MHLVIRLYRSSEYTNQRILFDIEPLGRHLGTGGQVFSFYSSLCGQIFFYSQISIPFFLKISICLLLRFWLQDGFVHIYDLQTGNWVSSFQAALGIDVSHPLKSAWLNFAYILSLFSD